MSKRKRSYGGIYCIIPIGVLYDESLASSVRWRLRKYLGFTIKGFDNKTLDVLILKFIVDNINNILSKEGDVGYKNLPKDRNGKPTKASKRAIDFFVRIQDEIEGSFGYAIYHNGKRVYKALLPFSESQADSAAKKDLDDFFNVNRSKSSIQSQLNGKGWSIMIAVAHYMAPRIEATGAYPDRMYPGYGQMVLKGLAMKAAHNIREKLGRKFVGQLQYGYILSRKGWEGRVYRVI